MFAVRIGRRAKEVGFAVRASHGDGVGAPEVALRDRSARCGEYFGRADRLGAVLVIEEQADVHGEHLLVEDNRLLSMPAPVHALRGVVEQGVTA